MGTAKEMHATLQNLQAKLDSIINRIQSTIPNEEPIGIAHNSWNFPAITKSELIQEAKLIIDVINTKPIDSLGTHEQVLTDYIRRLTFLEASTVPQLWGNAPQAIPAYMITLNGLRDALLPALKIDDKRGMLEQLRTVTSGIRSMEARLKGLEPRSSSLNSMVERIEKAYQAAEQLPTDLQTLKETRDEMSSLLEKSKKILYNIEKITEKSEINKTKIDSISKESDEVLKKCETAYSAATSVGLAAAFSERSASLSKSMWVWVAGLIGSLVAGSYFGTRNLHILSELFKNPNTSQSTITFNLMLSFLSVGAPVWFAWLSTKQIGQRFRLAEDYAFKASVSRAYEGFRREASRIDSEMEEKLLNSALNRLDELPLRLVETTTYGSPWHELASSDIFKSAMKSVPGFADNVKELAQNLVSSLHNKKVSDPKPEKKEA